jgi:hypothetical protein
MRFLDYSEYGFKDTPEKVICNIAEICFPDFAILWFYGGLFYFIPDLRFRFYWGSRG